MTGTITLHGSHGTAEFDAVTGEFISTQPDYGGDGYPDIARLHIVEWRAAYPGEDPLTSDWDVLDWGYWTRAGQYEPPANDWRGLVVQMKMDDAAYRTEDRFDRPLALPGEGPRT